MPISTKNSVERIASASGWLFFDRLFRSGLGFVVSILIARHYGPAQWGALSFVLASSILFGSIASAGSENLVMRDLGKAKTEQEYADIQKTALVLRLLFGSIAYGSLLLLVFIAEGIGLPFYLALVYGLVFIFQVSEVWEGRLRIDDKISVVAKTHMMSGLTSSALKLGTLFLGWPLLSIAFSMLAEYVLNFFVLARYRLKHWSSHWGSFQTDYAKALLRGSSLVMLSGFLIACQSRAEYYLINHFLGLEALGLYAAAFKCIEMVDVVVLVFSMTLVPELVKRHQLELPILISRTYLLGLLLFIATLFPIALIYWVFPLVYGDSYLAAQDLIVWFSFRPLFIILGTIRGIFLVMEGNLRYMPTCSAIGLLGSVVSGLVLIPHFGLEGAAISGLIGLAISNFAMDVVFKPQNIRHLLFCYRQWPYCWDRALGLLGMKKNG